MRLLVLLASTSMLAACGGGGPSSVSSTPPPATGGGTTGGGTANTTHTFANPKEAKTYKGIGGNHTYVYNVDDRLPTRNQQGELYAGNTTTARNSSISVSYDPADAVYTLVVSDALTGASTQTRFQDPASRTDFGGAVEPQWGTPELSNPNVKYLQAGDGDPLSPYRKSGTGFINAGDNQNAPTGSAGSSYQATSLFFLKPGTETQYVTYAGYVRNALSFTEFTLVGDPVPHAQAKFDLERGAFAFGENTAIDSVPTTGTGSFSGSMLATMVYNPTIDGQDISGLTDLPTYFQWIEGTANLNVDFAASSFNLSLNGTVTKPFYDYWTEPHINVVPEGSTFTAAGKGDINLVNFGGFKGFFESASLTSTDGLRNVNIEGSTIDGAFYGPKAEEVGGGFRIVGGNPDERVDILGAFIGKK